MKCRFYVVGSWPALPELAGVNFFEACRDSWHQAVVALGSEARLRHRESAMPFRRATRLEHEAQGITVREAAVVLLLFPDSLGIWRGALMERTPYDGVHSGQVSIPGGEREHHDFDFQSTGLREFHEEMGVLVNPSAVIGQLHSLYIPPSRFAVEPFVAVAPQEPQWSPDPVEVAAVLRPSCAEIAAQGALKPMPVEVRSGVRMDMPSFDVEGRAVWGATALMLTEFAAIWREIVRGGGWPSGGA